MHKARVRCQQQQFVFLRFVSINTFFTPSTSDSVYITQERWKEYGLFFLPAKYIFCNIVIYPLHLQVISQLFNSPPFDVEPQVFVN